MHASNSSVRRRSYVWHSLDKPFEQTPVLTDQTLPTPVLLINTPVATVPPPRNAALVMDCLA